MKRTRAFKVIMSSGNPIRIDEEEMEKVKLAINTGKPVLVKQGLINPNFLVEIVSDRERYDDWADMTRHGFGYEGVLEAGIAPLENLTGVKEIEQLASKEAKELSDKMRLNQG